MHELKVKEKYALLDVDHSLFNTTMSIRAMRELEKRGMFKQDSLGYLEARLKDYKEKKRLATGEGVFGGKMIEDICRTWCEGLAGQDQSRIHQILRDEILPDLIEKHAYKNLERALQHLNDNNHKIVFVSSGPKEVNEIIAEILSQRTGVPIGVEGFESDITDGCYDPHPSIDSIRSKILLKEEKGNIAKRFEGKVGFAYGNSSVDIDMIRIAEKGLLRPTTKESRKLAEDSGIPIEDWRRSPESTDLLELFRKHSSY